MASITCPGCDIKLELHEREYRAGFTFRCSECGLKIRLDSKGGDVVFPTTAPVETLLDMGDLNIRRPTKPPGK